MSHSLDRPHDDPVGFAGWLGPVRKRETMIWQLIAKPSYVQLSDEQLKMGCARRCTTDAVEEPICQVACVLDLQCRSY